MADAKEMFLMPDCHNNAFPALCLVASWQLAMCLFLKFLALEHVAEHAQVPIAPALAVEYSDSRAAPRTGDLPCGGIGGGDGDQPSRSTAEVVRAGRALWDGLVPNDKCHACSGSCGCNYFSSEDCETEWLGEEVAQWHGEAAVKPKQRDVELLSAGVREKGVLSESVTGPALPSCDNR